MGDETSEPRDPNHIWLRQSVTFTVNGQTRTVEMALPLRPGATPGEVEALLDEADAGMRRLSRRLDAHLAELRTTSATASQPAERPSAPQATPASAAPEAARQPAPRPTPPPPAQPAARPSAPAGADLTIPEFIAQAAAIGFDSRRAMEKLNVRSLSNLNLREALESLRRQALLEGGGPAPASAPRPPAAPPLAFEEEEEVRDTFGSEPEMELTYPDLADLPDDDAEDEEDFFAEESAPPTAPDLSALRRDARLTSAAKLPPPAPRRASPPKESGIPETPAPPLAPEPAPEETPGSRAARILAEMRATHGGGAPSAHVRTAFRNVVTDQLRGEKGAEALTKGIWNLPPDKLEAEQMEALINWGKRDDFVVEAREVLLAARSAAQSSTPREEPPAQEPPTPPARGARSTSRSRPASQAEEPRGSR